MRALFLAGLLALLAAGSPWPAAAQAPEPGPADPRPRIFLPLVQAGPGEGQDVPPRRYTVQPGDTLLTAAVELGMDLEQMACLIRPDFTWDQPLVIGDTLEAPAHPFACHRVAPGESLTQIAAQYGVPPQAILAESWNQLTGEPVPGLHLRVPLAPSSAPSTFASPAGLVSPAWRQDPVGGPGAGPEAIAPPDWPFGSGQFAWPVTGWLTQGYHADHRAIDVAAPLGAPVTAADRGVVVRAGWSDIGYGLFVVIDHNIDYLTLYAHLSQVTVQEGQVVAKGQLIGRVGSTGNSSGPHLHFEIRDFGALVDPLRLLPR